MIKDFLILDFIGTEDKIGLKVNNNFFIHRFDQEIKNNDQLVLNILNLIKKHKVNFNSNFSILVNNGPGSFSSIRVSLAVAKGINISKKASLYGYKDSDLAEFNLKNIDFLKKCKPLYQYYIGCVNLLDLNEFLQHQLHFQMNFE